MELVADLTRGVEQAQGHFEGVNDDAPGAHGAAFARSDGQQTLEAELPGADYVGFEARVEDEEAVLLFEGGQVPTECGGVLADLFGRLLEADEDARLAVQRAPVEEFQSEERLAGAGSAVDNRGSAAGQAAFQDVIQALDVGGRFRQGRGGGGSIAGAGRVRLVFRGGNRAGLSHGRVLFIPKSFVAGHQRLWLLGRQFVVRRRIEPGTGSLVSRDMGWERERADYHIPSRLLTRSQAVK